MGNDPDFAAPTPAQGSRREQKMPLKERIQQLSTAGQFEAQIKAFKENFPLWHTQHGQNLRYSLGEPQVLLQPLEPCQFSASVGTNKETGGLEICMRPMPIRSEKHDDTQQQLKAAAFGLDARLMQDAESRQFVLNIHKTRAAPSLQREWAQILQTHAGENHLTQALALWETVLAKVPSKAPQAAAVLQIPSAAAQARWSKAFSSTAGMLTGNELYYLAIASVHDANYLAQRPPLQAPAVAAPRLTAQMPGAAHSATLAQWLASVHQEAQCCGATPGNYALYAGQPNVLREGRLFSYGRLPSNLPGHESKTHYMVLEVAADKTAERDLGATAPKRMEVYTFTDPQHTVPQGIARIQGVSRMTRSLLYGPESPAFFVNVNAQGFPVPSKVMPSIARAPALESAARLSKQSTQPCMIL